MAAEKDQLVCVSFSRWQIPVSAYECVRVTRPRASERGSTPYIWSLRSVSAKLYKSEMYFANFVLLGSVHTHFYFHQNGDLGTLLIRFNAFVVVVFPSMCCKYVKEMKGATWRDSMTSAATAPREMLQRSFNRFNCLCNCHCIKINSQ